MPRAPGPPALHYDVHGDPAGVGVLLVMGLGMRGVVWRPQIAALAPVAKVVTFDHAGLGQSEPRRGWPSMAELAADALRVADAAGLDQFHLVGVSLGGMVSQHLALTAPDRLRSLSLVATQAGGPAAWLPPRAGVRAIAKLARSRSPAERAAALESLLFAEGYTERMSIEARRQRATDASDVPAPAATVARQLAAVIGHRAGHRLGQIGAPTLIVMPSDDALIRPAHSERLARHMPHARLVRVERAGHGILWERGHAVNALLLEHIRAADAAITSRGSGG